jgi:hypothetical protein
MAIVGEPHFPTMAIIGKPHFPITAVIGELYFLMTAIVGEPYFEVKHKKGEHTSADIVRVCPSSFQDTGITHSANSASSNPTR